MSSLEDKARAVGEGAKGNVEEAAGKLTGDRSTEARGKADRAKGEADMKMGEAKDKGARAAEHVKEKLR